MPPVTVIKKIGLPIHTARYCNNGMLVSAHLEQRIRQGLNTIAKHGGKCLFNVGESARHVPLSSGAAERVRWRHYGHTGMHTAELGVVVVLARQAPDGIGGGTTADPYCRYRLTRVADASTQDLEFHYGHIPGTPTDVPNELTVATSSLPVEAREDYHGTFSDFDGRLVSACVYEITEDATTTNNYLIHNVSIGQPVFDVRRSEAMTLGTNMWKWSAAHCFNIICSRTRTSTTDINLIDDTSTAISAATPGYVLDMRYKTTLSQSEVPVKVAVHGHCAGGGTGHVYLKDSAGNVKVTVNINSATPGWFTGTGTLDDVEGKIDPHYDSDGTNVTTVNAVSCFEYLA
jgi:hypothetical protein